jgi:hypothetical protein
MTFSRLVATSGLAFSFSIAAAYASPLETFNYTGSTQIYVVPQAGSYQITAFGAQGGTSGIIQGNTVAGIGGFGAEVVGTFYFPAAGLTLLIDVGQAGFAGS